jgi:hypothetical protein
VRVSHTTLSQHRVRLEESEAAGAIREAVEKVERWIVGAEGQEVGRMRRGSNGKKPEKFKR